jgi:hypothetical protein
MLIAIALPAHAQVNLDPPSGMATPVDFYGNAQSLHPERRPLDIFQNDVQRQILRGYQTLNRPLNQRGYGTSFALPADQFMKTMAGRQRSGFALPGTWQQRQNAFGLQERERKAAFSSYGGFGQRRSPYVPCSGKPDCRDEFNCPIEHQTESRCTGLDSFYRPNALWSPAARGP